MIKNSYIPTMPTMQHCLSFLLLLLTATVVPVPALPLPSSSPVQQRQSVVAPGKTSEPSDCALSLVALSPCLSYMAGPPNHATPAPSLVCCGTFYQSIVSAGPACMCYLLRDPLILGFPIDTGRLVAMFPSCKVNTTSSAVHWLYETCRVTETETEALLPLPGIASGPSTAIIVNSSSADMWAQGHPTPAKSIACQVEMHHLWGGLTMIWLMLSIILHM